MRNVPRLFRRISPELLYGLFHAFLWLLLALEVSTGVVRPLAEVFAAAPSALVQ